MIIAKECIRLLASMKEQTSPSMYPTTKKKKKEEERKPREKSDEKRDLKMFFKN